MECSHSDIQKRKGWWLGDGNNGWWEARGSALW